MAFDFIVRGATLVTAAGLRRADLAIEGEHIAHIDDEIKDSSFKTIDASGLHIFPGLMDTHVHFNDPGRSDWEGIATGSAALAAGGGTLFADMPLNSSPPVLDAGAFELKKTNAERNAYTDFALWGGLTPDNLDHLEALAELGVIGFKAFMSNSGMADFARIDDLALLEGMRRAAQLNLPVALHAESEALTRDLTNAIRANGGHEARDYLASRPVIAELEAVNRALLYGRETGCDLHFVHLSSARSVALVQRAKAEGQRVTCETCPHYLHFTDEAVTRLGAVAKCAPPLRSEEERKALWRALRRGEIDLIGSDHSPSPPALKAPEDFFEVWGGMAGIQSSLSVLLTHMDEEALALPTLARLCAANPAARFGLPHKGQLKPGFDADFCLLDLQKRSTLEPATLLTRHKLSPYLGESLRGHIHSTYLRGKPIFQNGKLSAVPSGRFIRPS